MNELNLETSPYLLQHANNPVHWKAWNKNSLALAKELNRLIIVSVGYSACHWCHVMEHESFENELVAQTMNHHFISIKVDREERPDIDAVYMKAIQIMTGRGGWPMNVVCLPDGRPIWGGTYFRANEWIDYLEQLQKLFLEQPEKLEEYATQLHYGLESVSIVQNDDSKTELELLSIEPLVTKWKKSFDWEYGGMARAPKFMMPNNFEFLLRYAYQNKDKELEKFVNLTLTKMAAGGLFDTVAGGFSRYSVDLKWHVPHFEKMLYDNGQLVSLYSNAYKLYKNKNYKDVIEKTLLFVEKEWLSKYDSFYSALDADSINKENILEEGAYYVWQKKELQEILQDDFEIFSIFFNINEFGLWEHENYVLIQNKSIEEIASENKIAVETLSEMKKNWEEKLYKAREKRNKPRLDDKSLCSWNAIMLKGFVDGYKALQNPKYLEIAIKNATFITTYLWSENGNLFHTFKDGKSSINGYLEDYSFVIDAFISLYQATLNEQWLQSAKQLTDYCLDHFYDEEKQFFRFTSLQDDPLITTHFEIEDNVIAASNSVMANNLLLMSLYFNHTHYEKLARLMLQHVFPNIDYPSAYSNWLNLFLNFNEKNKELVICSESALDEITKLNSFYLPNIVISGTSKPSKLPILENRFIENKTLFYLCQNKTCNLPSTDLNLILKEIIID